MLSDIGGPEHSALLGVDLNLSLERVSAIAGAPGAKVLAPAGHTCVAVERRDQYLGLLAADASNMDGLSVPTFLGVEVTIMWSFMTPLCSDCAGGRSQSRRRCSERTELAGRDSPQ